MLKTASELIVRIADLMEAEGRLFRTTAFQLATAVGVLAIAVCVLLAGAGLLLACVYVYVSDHAGPAAGAGACSLLALVSGGGLVWLARRMAH